MAQLSLSKVQYFFLMKLYFSASYQESIHLDLSENSEIVLQVLWMLKLIFKLSFSLVLVRY